MIKKEAFPELDFVIQNIFVEKEDIKQGNLLSVSELDNFFGEDNPPEEDVKK